MATQDRSLGRFQEREIPGFGSGELSQTAGHDPADPSFGPPYPPGPAASPLTNEYAELRRLVKQQGLLDKQPLYYIGKILLVLVLLALSVTLLLVLDTLWLQLMNAVFLAFVFVQISLIGHSAGHYQMFHSTWKDDAVGLIVTMLVGVSRSWWIDKHNRHHRNPNQIGLDPDTFIPVIAFSEDQAMGREGFYGLVVKYQSFLYFPMLCLQSLGIRLASLQHLWRFRPRFFVAETTLLGLSLAIYVAVPFFVLSVWHAALFLIVLQTVFGLYMGSVFAPNHKGMPILEKGSRMDFMRQQVLTARNVTANPLTDFWYGGLNYQIEHHLFPNMPHNKLREAKKIVKPYCQARSIPYYETSMFQSQKEILQHLHRVSAPLRQRKA